jgi:hypothetical protein
MSAWILRASFQVSVGPFPDSPDRRYPNPKHCQSLLSSTSGHFVYCGVVHREKERHKQSSKQRRTTPL